MVHASERVDGQVGEICSSLLEGERDLLGHEGAAFDGVQQLLGAFLRPRGDRDDHLQRSSESSDSHARLCIASAVPHASMTMPESTEFFAVMFLELMAVLFAVWSPVKA